MKKISRCIAILLLISSCSPKPKQEASVIRLGNSANEKEADLKDFAASLEKVTGLQVEFVVSKDYEDLVKQFKDGKVDFAFFSPVNFITAEKDAGAKVLLKKVYGESEFYYSALIVKNDSNIKTVIELKGKKIAFVDPQSTSGYLYPLVSLKNAGITLKDIEYKFEGTHDKAVLALVESRSVAAAVWANDPVSPSGAWTAHETESQKFRVLSWSEPIPNDAFAVRSEFYQKHPDLVFKVMEGLIVMSDTSDKSLKKAFNTDRMTTATSRHYDSVRNIIEAQKIQ